MPLDEGVLVDGAVDPEGNANGDRFLVAGIQNSPSTNGRPEDLVAILLIGVIVDASLAGDLLCVWADAISFGDRGADPTEEVVESGEPGGVRGDRGEVGDNGDDACEGGSGCCVSRLTRAERVNLLPGAERALGGSVAAWDEEARMAAAAPRGVLDVDAMG